MALGASSSRSCHEQTIHPDTLKYLRGLRYDPAMRMDYQDFLLEDVLPGSSTLAGWGDAEARAIGRPNRP